MKTVTGSEEPERFDYDRAAEEYRHAHRSVLTALRERLDRARSLRRGKAKA